MGPIHRLYELGQSVWLDLLDRDVLHSGELDRLISDEGIRGLTSNPTRFEHALATGTTYDDDIRRAHHAETDAHVLERIMVRDAQVACDKLRSVHEASGGRDGFASIDLSPLVAHDTEGAVGEARRLWWKVSRPNLMVKIPATNEGVATIFRCLSEGININATLIFSETRYLDVVDAYLRALEGRAGRSEPIDRVAAVTSFFLSRVDAKVDEALDALGEDEPVGEPTVPLRGRIAIANALVVREDFDAMKCGGRWIRLARLGAKPQRLSWASTSPKDEAYDALRYIEALVAPGTVATMTLEVFHAYLRAHGEESCFIRELDDAFVDPHHVLESLGSLGIDLRAIARGLETDGVRQFADSFRASLVRIAQKRRSISAA
jgi:transaldolase